MQIDTAITVLEQIHDGYSHIGEYFQRIFQNVPVGVFWKDIHSTYVGCNQHTANLAGYEHPLEMIGKTDFEFCWQEEASKYCAGDQIVIQNNRPKLNIIEPQHQSNGKCVMIYAIKMPTYDAIGQINGVVGYFSDILTATNLGWLRSPHDCLQLFSQQSENRKTYYILHEEKVICLTARQAACLTFLATGKTVKQIASTLDCAYSTTEDHIERLKQKLGVCSTAALIDCFWGNPIKWF